MENKELETQDTVMTPDVYRKTFWRTFPLQACFCFERMQNVGFAYMMIPALKKLYKNKKDISYALKRHLAILIRLLQLSVLLLVRQLPWKKNLKKLKIKAKKLMRNQLML